MVRDPQNRMRFGAAEWLALGGLILMMGASAASSVGVLWAYSDRVLTLENEQHHTAETLEEIKDHVELIPRIDQRVMALEQAARKP